MTQSIRQKAETNCSTLPLERLPEELGGKILGYLCNDPNALNLVLVNRAFKKAMENALWEEWITDEIHLVDTDSDIPPETLHTSFSTKALVADVLEQHLIREYNEIAGKAKPFQSMLQIRTARVTELHRRQEEIGAQNDQPDAVPNEMVDPLMQEANRILQETHRTTEILRQINEEMRAITRIQKVVDRFVNLKMRVERCIQHVRIEGGMHLFRKLIHRLISDLSRVKAAHTENELMKSLKDFPEILAESSLLNRALTLIHRKNVELAPGSQLNIFACYGQLYEQQKEAASVTVRKRALFQNVQEKWKGTFSIERFLEQERIACQTTEEDDEEALAFEQAPNAVPVQQPAQNGDVQQGQVGQVVAEQENMPHQNEIPPVAIEEQHIQALPEQVPVEPIAHVVAAQSELVNREERTPAGIEDSEAGISNRERASVPSSSHVETGQTQTMCFRHQFIETFAVPIDRFDYLFRSNEPGVFNDLWRGSAIGFIRLALFLWNLSIIYLMEPLVRGLRFCLGYTN